MDIRATISSVYPILFMVLTHVVRTHGHGRLVEPPSRSSMWRYGFKTPVNYNDNQLFCGGFDVSVTTEELEDLPHPHESFARALSTQINIHSMLSVSRAPQRRTHVGWVQWHQNNGRCGICGDPFNGPRENEAGGRYATGAIARRYTMGQTVTFGVEITANHGGYFEFRICRNNDPSRPATEACLNRNLLLQPNGETRWQVPAGAGAGKFTIDLVLPGGLTCTQCVLQWKYNTASSWGCEHHNCCKGCGQQEQFYGCADVTITTGSISASGGLASRSSAGNPAYVGSTNHGAGLSSSNSGPSNQGTDFIPIDSGSFNQNAALCETMPKWKSAFFDRWCRTQCASDNCPAEYCRCTTTTT